MHRQSSLVIGFHPGDDELRRELVRHLSPLQRAGKLLIWDTTQVMAGQDLQVEMSQHIVQADILLLLVSADFLADCPWEDWLRTAKQHGRTSWVIPVLLRPVYWKTGLLADLQPLPRDGKPVMNWAQRDGAFLDIVLEIESILGRLAESPPDPEAMGSQAPDGGALREQLDTLNLARARLRDTGQRSPELDEKIAALKRLQRHKPQLSAGDILANRYRLNKIIGQGMFAKIWHAHDQKANMSVAVKVLRTEHTDDKSLRDRFYRGAMKLKTLQHAHVVRVLDEPAEERGFYYFVMEFLPGGDLEAAVLNKSIDQDAALRAVLQAGEALSFAHKWGLVHRDIQPQNILLDHDGTARLSDFDLVQAAYSIGGTLSNAMLGSPLYAAPEQQQDAKHVDQRADVYSLALTVMFVLVGRKWTKEDILHLEELLKDCPEPARKLLCAATATQPVDRPPTVVDFCSRLERALWLADSPERDFLRSERAPADPYLGKRYGPYQITRLIGAGGMAAVYEAEDTRLSRPVAIKFLPEARKQQTIAVERFIAEAQVAGRLNHPNIIAIFDIGYENDMYYIAMELLNPDSAGSFIKRRGRLHWVEATQIIIQCCHGLEAAHQAGLVHRDIKPDNILCSPAGTAKLADFGLVKELHSGEDLTLSRAVVGTPLFMSPEQCSAQPLDSRSDLYSLGCTYYALLTGSAPYGGGSVPHIMMQHCKAKVPDPRLLAPDVPESAVHVIERAMSKQPDARYQTAIEFRLALTKLIEGVQIPQHEFLLISKQMLPPQRLRAVAKPAAAVPPAPPSDKTDRPARPVEAELVPLGSAVKERSDFPGRRSALIMGLGLLGSGFGIVWWNQRGRRLGKPTSGPISGPGEGLGSMPRSGLAPVTRSGEPLHVGVVNSVSGPLSIGARPVIDATLLAFKEVNERGGLLGRPVEVTIHDAKSDNDTIAPEVERLLAKHRVLAIFGGWSPSNRRSLRRVIEGYNNLLMFPIWDEGLEDSIHVFYCGSTPNQLVLPTLRHFVSELGAQRIYCIGTDDLLSHISIELITDELVNQKARVVDYHYSPFGKDTFATPIKKIHAAKPDVIFNFLTGESNLDFFKELREAGMTPRQIPTVSFSFGESELSQLAGIDIAGDYLAGSYFQSIKSQANLAFVQRFQRQYGAYRAVGAAVETAYNSVHLWAQAVTAAGVPEVERIRSALAGQSFEGPGGPIRVDPSTHHCFKSFHLARIEASGPVNIIYSSPELIRPEPFPATRTRAEWEALLEHLHKSWDGKWTGPSERQPRK